MSGDRYADQLKLPGWGEEAQRRLRGATVYVIGAGAIGSAAAVFIAGAGVGRLAVVDGSSISESEMQRQLIHFTPEAGMGKADSAAAKLSLLNPDVHVDPFPADLTAENADVILMDADVVLDCSSRAEVRLLVNDACVRAGIPFVSAASGGYSGASMAVNPGVSACCRCAGESLEEPGFDLPSRAQAGIYGPIAGVVGSLAAHRALALLLGVADARAGWILGISGATTDWSAREIARSADCICADGSSAGNV